ncbi:putative response regulatory protein [Fibrella aestuarina BUZ 2]|uniref:Putative response regulatory protein n=1 Tax=Fibrella aestuarina BUZ 2 TaxID=1166018 RepID=I0K553_9BACT|nr:LytTR family DNA-binding domain-containing protein [Fibrella aestuarina]CCG99256.1 putative response regulatory protein [Fibrella aestuarina BUZ 2]
MINCLILDDEHAAINILKRYVNDTPYLKLVGATTNVFEAADMLEWGGIDLLFLDIQMPRLTGLQFLDLYSGNYRVIMTTAYSEYALEGFERNVVDYLLKPIPYQRFLKATEKVFNQIARPVPASVAAEKDEEPDFILVKTEHKGKYRKIDLAEIVYVEGLKNYVSIYTDKKERIVTYIGISDLEERLPDRLFTRVHRSYIVATRMITAIDGNEILMKGAPRIPTSGKYKEDLLLKFSKQLIQTK